MFFSQTNKAKTISAYQLSDQYQDKNQCNPFYFEIDAVATRKRNCIIFKSSFFSYRNSLLLFILFMITNNLGKLAAASRVPSTPSLSSHICFISHLHSKQYRGYVGTFSSQSIRFLTSSSSSSRQSQQKKLIGKQRIQRKETNKRNKYKPMHRESTRELSFPHFATQISDEKDNNDESNEYSNSLSKKGDFEKKTSTASFFDAVDARMKELQLEQEKARNQKRRSQKSSTRSKSVFDSSYLSLNDSSNTNDKNKKKLRSIFDVFPLENDERNGAEHESSIERNGKQSNSIESNINNYTFDTSLFEVYEEAMKEIIDSPRFSNKKDKKSDIEIAIQYLMDDQKKIPIHLPTLQTSNSSCASVHSPSDYSKLKDQFHKELEQQRQQFMKKTNMTQTQYQLALRGFCILGDFCAKRSMANPLYIAWKKIKEAGMIPREQSMNTFLYAVSVGESMITDATSNSNSITSPVKPSILLLNDTTYDSTKDKDSLDVPSEIATFHDILYKPTEKSVSLRVKRLVAKGKFTDAEAMLEMPIYENSQKKENLLKLRTYFPILRGYCEQGNCEAALKLFKRMKQSPGVQLESENHVLVIATLAANGYFRNDKKPIKSAIDLGYSVGNGPVLFDELAQEMADDVLEITSASARRLSNAFKSAHTINNPDPKISCDTIPNAMLDKNEIKSDDEDDYLLKALPSLVAIPQNNETAAAHTLVVSRIAVDGNTAVCPRTKARLRLIMLEEHQKQEFHDALIRLSSEQFQTFVTSNANFDPSLNEDDDYPKEQLNKFSDWLT